MVLSDETCQPNVRRCSNIVCHRSIYRISLDNTKQWVPTHQPNGQLIRGQNKAQGLDQWALSSPLDDALVMLIVVASLVKWSCCAHEACIID
jgi:hypothetical protein